MRTMLITIIFIGILFLLNIFIKNDYCFLGKIINDTYHYHICNSEERKLYKDMRYNSNKSEEIELIGGQPTEGGYFGEVEIIPGDKEKQ